MQQVFGASSVLVAQQKEPEGNHQWRCKSVASGDAETTSELDAQPSLELQR